MRRLGLCQLCVLNVVFVITNASVISFQASPSVLKANLTSSASMRCSLGDNAIGTRSVSSTDDDVLHVTAIHITRKNGADVASVTPFDAAMAETDLGNLEVKGDVTGTSSEGYLQLTWKDPSAMAMGEYVCEVSTISATHHKTVVFTTTLEMTEVNPSIMDIITEMKANQNDLKKTQDDLKRTQDKLEANSEEQTKTNNDLKQQQSKLKDCTSHRAGFMAVISSNFKGGKVAITAANKPVVFDKVVYSSGRAYDNTTGAFVCTDPGEYHFSVHVLNSHHNDIVLVLRLNSKVITSFYTTSPSVVSASATAVLHLNENDVVDVVTSPAYGAAFYQDVNIMQGNVFAGHLVQSDACLV